MNQEEMLDRSLNILGETLTAEGSALISKRFLDKHNFSLECLGYWAFPDKRGARNLCKFESLQPEDLPIDWWKCLEDHEIVFEKEPSSPSLLGLSNLSLIPLFLDEDLYGFLVVLNVENDGSLESNQDFMKAVSHSFELWIAKQNLNKRLNDYINFIPSPSLIVDESGVITTWNRASEEFTGWSAERMEGKGNYEQALAYHGERRPTVSNLILEPDPEWEARYLDFRREGDDVFALVYCPAVLGGGGIC